MRGKEKTVCWLIRKNDRPLLRGRMIASVRKPAGWLTARCQFTIGTRPYGAAARRRMNAQAPLFRVPRHACRYWSPFPLLFFLRPAPPSPHSVASLPRCSERVCGRRINYVWIGADGGTGGSRVRPVFPKFLSFPSLYTYAILHCQTLSLKVKKNA